MGCSGLGRAVAQVPAESQLALASFPPWMLCECPQSLSSNRLSGLELVKMWDFHFLFESAFVFLVFFFVCLGFFLISYLLILQDFFTRE